MNDLVLESYKEQVISQWKTELHDRIIPDRMETLRNCKELHTKADATDLDIANWKTITKLKRELGKDTIRKKCLLTQLKDALDNGNYDKAAKMQIEIQKKVDELLDIYATYTKNIF